MGQSFRKISQSVEQMSGQIREISGAIQEISEVAVQRLLPPFKILILLAKILHYKLRLYRQPPKNNQQPWKKLLIPVIPWQKWPKNYKLLFINLKCRM